jgi:hypothetical protein
LFAGRFKTVDIEEIANNAELRLRTVEKAGYMWLQNLRDRFDRCEDHAHR